MNGAYFESQVEGIGTVLLSNSAQMYSRVFHQGICFILYFGRLRR